MPIKGLTDQQPAFPRIGVLRKGAPKPERGNRPGRDLDHFRFTSDEPELVEEFHAAYGAEPCEINVTLPYATPEQNFEAWKEEHVAGGLVHRCDGEYVVIRQNGDGEYERPDYGTVECPGGCKPVGRLHVIIPELSRLAYVDAQTTSVHDIITLQQNLNAMHTLRGDLRGIPFVLKRRPRKVSTPTDGNGRARRTMWLLSIEAAPRWVREKLESMEREALPVTEPRLILEDSGEVDWENDKFQEILAKWVAQVNKMLSARGLGEEHHYRHHKHARHVLANLGEIPSRDSWPALDPEILESLTEPLITYKLDKVNEAEEENASDETTTPARADQLQRLRDEVNDRTDGFYESVGQMAQVLRAELDDFEAWPGTLTAKQGNEYIVALVRFATDATAAQEDIPW